MADSMDEILHPRERRRPREFPHAPEGWDEESARRLAEEEQVVLTKGSWDLIRFLQEYAASHPRIELRRLNQALEAHFEGTGGRRYLYQLFPGGPIHQGSRIAGLEPPHGSADDSFGSVQ